MITRLKSVARCGGCGQEGDGGCREEQRARFPLFLRAKEGATNVRNESMKQDRICRTKKRDTELQLQIFASSR